MAKVLCTWEERNNNRERWFTMVGGVSLTVSSVNPMKLGWSRRCHWLRELARPTTRSPSPATSAPGSLRPCIDPSRSRTCLPRGRRNSTLAPQGRKSCPPMRSQCSFCIPSISSLLPASASRARRRRARCLVIPVALQDVCRA